MHRIKRMTQSPVACLACGRGNTPDDPDTMDDLWFLDMEIDTNWGDAVYICKYCAEKIGINSGLVGMQELKETQEMSRRQAKKIHDLEAKLEARDRRLAAIGRGRQAVKRTRKEHEDIVGELQKRTKERASADE